MNRSKLIAIAVGSILGASLPGAFAQTPSPDDNQRPQANPPHVSPDARDGMTCVQTIGSGRRSVRPGHPF